MTTPNASENFDAIRSLDRLNDRLTISLEYLRRKVAEIRMFHPETGDRDTALLLHAASELLSAHANEARRICEGYAEKAGVDLEAVIDAAIAQQRAENEAAEAALADK